MNIPQADIPYMAAVLPRFLFSYALTWHGLCYIYITKCDNKQYNQIVLKVFFRKSKGLYHSTCNDVLCLTTFILKFWKVRHCVPVSKDFPKLFRLCNLFHFSSTNKVTDLNVWFIAFIWKKYFSKNVYFMSAFLE